MKKLLKHLKTLSPLGPEQADMSLPRFHPIFLQLGLHYVVVVSHLSPRLFQACLFHVESAFVKETIKFIQQLLKVSSHRMACGENSLSKALKLYNKNICSGFKEFAAQFPELRAGDWRILPSSGTAFFKHLLTIKHRGLSLNTNCNTSSPLHVFRALHLILPAEEFFPVKSIMMSQQESFEFLGYLQLERQGPVCMLDNKSHSSI